MRNVVLGLGFGDEGKGLVTDYLCRTLSKGTNGQPMVVRFSGGHQAGHTVCAGEKRHVFSNFGSGTLRGASSYFQETCVIDPIGIMNEYKVLKSKNVTPRLYIHPDCPVCTPYDKYANEESDEMKEHGTCGMGVYTTLLREKKGYHLQAGDMLYSSVFKIKMDLLESNYKEQLGTRLDMSLFESAIAFIKKCTDIKIIDYNIPRGDVIYEGSQGAMLDESIGFYPHVTATRVVPNWQSCNPYEKVFLVTRAYCTRHGNGPMPNNVPGDILIPETETNQENKYQGKLRTCLLDIDMLRYAVRKCRESVILEPVLVITCLDHLRETEGDNGKITRWKLVEEGKVISFETENDFVKYIANKVGINYLLLSRSPYSDFMEERIIEK